MKHLITIVITVTVSVLPALPTVANPMADQAVGPNRSGVIAAVRAGGKARILGQP